MRSDSDLEAFQRRSSLRLRFLASLASGESQFFDFPGPDRWPVSDITSGSYANDSASPTIYSFYSNVSPGYKIVGRPSPSLVFSPVSKNEINSMRVWLTDQNNDRIDLRGEQITVRIYIRKVKNVKRDIVRAIKTLKQDEVL